MEICSYAQATIFEVTPKGKTVWNYIVPNDSKSPFGNFANPGVVFGGKVGGNPVFGAYRYGKDAYFSRGDPNNSCDLAHFWSFHSGGANWLFADGSVQFLTYDAGLKTILEKSSIYED
jgi:prepilin-type processing-associated H-X9-DG protein